MSIKDLTITDQNVQSTYVQSQPDRLTGTAQQNKAVFDALPQLIIQRFNLLLEALAGTEAAGEIPVEPIEGVTAENVQQALEAIQQNLTAYINRIKSALGASEVGVSTISGMKAQNVQKALEELRKAIDDSVSGIIPGGSITLAMLADDVLKYFATATAPESVNIPLEGGFTGALRAERNQFGQVLLTGAVAAESINANDLIATLPDGFLPKASNERFTMVSNRGATVESSFATIGKIGREGDMRLWSVIPSNYATNTYLVINHKYQARI